MSIKPIFIFVLVLVLGVAGYFYLPTVFIQIALWQREINLLLAENLHKIQQKQALAGLMLVAVSFLYGILHAIGPGHGKFVIASYLSTHSSQFNSTIRLTLLASLVQGLVAICVTSVIVVVLNLSSSYFKMSQLWLERIAFSLLLLLGLSWCYQGIKKWRSKNIKIKKITALSSSELLIGQHFAQVKSAVDLSHNVSCDCGHQHLPSQQQLSQAKDYKTQALLILTIGIRPCSGAIFILFLAYMLDLYMWGIWASLTMAFGTGLTLTGFALLVRYARQTAISIGSWYGFSTKWQRQIDLIMKCGAGGILIFFALSLLYGTTMVQTNWLFSQ